jgi:hypothetical protein
VWFVFGEVGHIVRKLFALRRHADSMVVSLRVVLHGLYFRINTIVSDNVLQHQLQGQRRRLSAVLQ